MDIRTIISVALLMTVISLPSITSRNIPISVNCNPPAFGNWYINGKVVCANENVVVRGGVVVKPGASLTLIYSNLTFKEPSLPILFRGEDEASLTPPKPLILAKKNSSLIIRHSRINSLDSRYSFFVEENVNFVLTDSEVANFGSVDIEDFRNITKDEDICRYNLYNQYLGWVLGFICTGENCRYSNETEAPCYGKLLTYFYINDGMVVNSTPSEFKGNVFINYTSMRFYSSNNLIENNRFIGMKTEGLAFMGGSNNNVVRNNYFGHAARMNRTIYGLRFYPGSHNNQIYNNTFEWLPHPILVVVLPPWTRGNNFSFHDNRISHVLSGIDGDMENSRIYNNNWNYTAYGMLGIVGHNILVENNHFSNLTFFQELKDRGVLDFNYFREIVNRKIVKHYVYLDFGKVAYRAMLWLNWGGENITIRNNYFGYTPPFSSAISVDAARGFKNVYIVNNTFEYINYYKPENWTPIKPEVGQAYLDGLGYLPSGGTIVLERSDNFFIEKNVFKHVVNGVSTGGPDTLGYHGNLTVRNNVFYGVGNVTWQAVDLNWDTGHEQPITVEEKGMAVGFGTNAWDYQCKARCNCGNEFLNSTCLSNTTYIVQNNIIYNFYYGAVVDFRNFTYSINGTIYPSPMGQRKAVLSGNNLVSVKTPFKLIEKYPHKVYLFNNVIDDRKLPEVKFTSPHEGEVVHSTSLEVNVSVLDFVGVNNCILEFEGHNYTMKLRKVGSVPLKKKMGRDDLSADMHSIDVYLCTYMLRNMTPGEKAARVYVKDEFDYGNEDEVSFTVEIKRRRETPIIFKLLRYLGKIKVF